MLKSQRAAACALTLVLTLLVTGTRPPTAAQPSAQLPPDAQSTSGPLPPPSLAAQASVVPAAPVTIAGVPAYEWRHGCGPTAAGMVIGYWDGRGYGALVPGGASTQTPAVNQMIASGDVGGLAATNYADYCLPMDSNRDYPIQPDKSEPPAGDEHPDHCLADWMKTSQSAYWNRYGWGWFSTVRPALIGYVRWLGRPDYAVAAEDYWMSYTPTLSWEVFRAEIDAGRPVVLLVDTGGDGWTDHFVTAVGYDEATHAYGCLNTWDEYVWWHKFAPLGVGQAWGIYGGTTFRMWLTNPGVERITAAGSEQRRSGRPSLSADASLLAFDSDADLLGQGVPDDQFEVWLYDTASMIYTRVTTSAGTDRDSTMPVLSSDGSALAFASDADLLGEGNVADDQQEIWLYDTATRAYTRVTTGAPGRVSASAALNASGTLVAFASDADLLSQGNVADGQQEIWLYDTAALTYTRVTFGTPGRTSGNPALDAAGALVAFDSDADILGQGIPDGQFEVWLYDTAAVTYTRVTRATDAGRTSGSPSLDADGALLVFASDADLLGQGIPGGQLEVWLYDTVAAKYTRVTTATDQARDSYTPRISADGTTIVFVSDADFLGQGVPDDQFEIWRYDIASGISERLTWASDTDRDSYNPVLTADGETVAFAGDADLLAQVLPDEQFEIWLRRRTHVYVPTALREYP